LQRVRTSASSRQNYKISRRRQRCRLQLLPGLLEQLLLDLALDEDVDTLVVEHAFPGLGDEAVDGVVDGDGALVGGGRWR